MVSQRAPGTPCSSERVRVSGAMASERDIAEMNFDVGGRNVRLADIAEVRREYSDPPDPMFRINGTPGLGLSISPATAAGVAAMPGTRAGVASAVITTSRQVGGALGVAVLGAVAAAHYGRATPGNDPAAFLQGVHAAYLVAAAALAVGAVAAVLFLRPGQAAPEEAGPPLPAEAA